MRLKDTFAIYEREILHIICLDYFGGEFGCKKYNFLFPTEIGKKYNFLFPAEIGNFNLLAARNCWLQNYFEKSSVNVRTKHGT